jgi:K+-transporting ATPase ATPase C chain
MFAHLNHSIRMLLLLTVITGAAYPLLATGLAQLFFSHQANGSLIVDKASGKVAGSELIGQTFSEPKYFWGRPSATSPFPTNAGTSSGSNLGARNPALIEAVTARIKALKDADPANAAPVPVDLVTASGSGLDPHISVAAARYQVSRVARARGLTGGAVEQLVAAYTEGRQLGFLGEARVNVLKLNRALDAGPASPPAK